mgnify:CR=1 FL=1
MYISWWGNRVVSRQFFIITSLLRSWARAVDFCHERDQIAGDDWSCSKGIIATSLLKGRRKIWKSRGACSNAVSILCYPGWLVSWSVKTGGGHNFTGPADSDSSEFWVQRYHCFMNKVLVLQRIFIYSQAVSNRKMVKQRDNEPFSFLNWDSSKFVREV